MSLIVVLYILSKNVQKRTFRISKTESEKTMARKITEIKVSGQKDRYRRTGKVIFFLTCLMGFLFSDAAFSIKKGGAA